jgi:hypothetical protein
MSKVTDIVLKAAELQISLSRRELERLEGLKKPNRGRMELTIWATQNFENCVYQEMFLEHWLQLYEKLSILISKRMSDEEIILWISNHKKQTEAYILRWAYLEPENAVAEIIHKTKIRVYQNISGVCNDAPGDAPGSLKELLVELQKVMV